MGWRLSKMNYEKVLFKALAGSNPDPEIALWAFDQIELLHMIRQ